MHSVIDEDKLYATLASNYDNYHPYTTNTKKQLRQLSSSDDLPLRLGRIHSSSSSPSSDTDMGIISKRICLLVFTEDYICQNLVSEVLQHCTYEVLHVGRAMDALSAIGKRRNGISLVLTNMNRLKTNGAEIIQVIEEELNLSVCLILPGNMEFDTKGQDCNVSTYIVNFSDINDMKELWQSALEKEKKARKAAISSPVVGAGVENNNEASLDGESAGNDDHNQKAKEPLREEQNEESGGGTKKKPRLSWNPEMHQKFLQAINKLGNDKAVPKKIVELMDEPGLTREHVASHLQKYRMNLRKGQDGSSDFIYGQKLINDVTKPFYGLCPSALNFNPSQTYSSPFETNNNYSMFSTPLLGQSNLVNPNISTTLTQPHMFPRNNMQGPLNLNLNLNNVFTPQSAFDTNRLMMNQNGEMEFQSSLVPRTPITSKLMRVYGDEQNKIVSGIEKGHSSAAGSSSVSINQQQPPTSRFLGFRVVNDELQFGESCGETHRETSSFTADWTSSGNNNNNNAADSVPFLETSTDQSVNYSETISPAATFIPQQQASFPAFCSSAYNSDLLHGFSTQGINTNDNPSIVSLPLPGNSENFSSKQIESSSSLSVPPAVIEINSYGGEEDISALLDAADDMPNNPQEGLWDDDDFSDILFGITK